MKFRQLDKILAIEPGQSITACRTLRPDESILGDHFPQFPVMPGVLMLEALFQASMWLILSTEDFASTIVQLQTARNVKYSGFVAPQETLTVVSELIKHDGQTASFKASGHVEGPDKPRSPAVSARLVVERFCLADRYPHRTASDPLVRREMRLRFQELLEPVVSDTEV
jgi:3-hydroxyacyl-[acyl-carrier-protein] dehydratase